ncbi:hypothetical protein DVH26_30480 [Paenibacillus sp. H1-7]|uniref:hypothetical protein n=1 Tax=Paenibacillus sp. H1-7 TaxID=2282849 RepID=UPI001EF7C811|nr:hypothetical protein [Paenibacillus sp. H1-7]ULL18414.1 hypothetical protein DVH26_30480 [Paenibacillus sp. H1-7]
MFELTCKGWSWDSDLQIIHADVRLELDGEVVIDEPLCIDVGLPAMLYSIRHDVEPHRWADTKEWQRMPFFCCGCGDPECRGYSFRVRHDEPGMLQLTELEEREQGEARELGTYQVPVAVYREQVHAVAQQYVEFIEGLDYRPYFSDTVKVVKELLAKG